MYDMIKEVQEQNGYHLNPDRNLALEVLAGILTNRERYGYDSCPCRLVTGDREKDRAIICPCHFREEDVARYDRCYCGLYVSRQAAEGQCKIPEAIPERWLRW